MNARLHRPFTRLLVLVAVAIWPAAARAQHVDVLRSFAGSNAAFSQAAVIQGSDGRFYRSACPADGTAGAVFVLAASGDVSLLHEFDADTEGSCPNAVFDGHDGNLYGTTQSGGANGAGTLFRLSLTGTLTVLHTFTGGADGGTPTIGLIAALDGTLYGTTSRGGTANLGTVYHYGLSGSPLVVHSFAGGAGDGAGPSTGFVRGTDGNFYGTTVGGGTANRGVFFRMTPSGATTVLYSFSGSSADGSVLAGNIVEAPDGKFYGVSTYGKFLGAPLTILVCPLYFRISAAGAFERLPVPEQCSSASTFRFTLTAGPNSQLLGTADSFGSSSLFSLATDGRFTLLQRLDPAIAGGFLGSPLAAATDGHFYGTTGAGGAAGGGTFFRLRVVPDAPTDIAATSVQGQVRLSWKPSSNATSYTIRRREAGSAPSILATGVTTAAFVDATAVRHRYYYYLVSAVNEHGETVAAYEVSIRAGRATLNDFDGDGLADIAVWRWSDHDWFIRLSATATARGLHLLGGPCPGDYDGDGITDVAGFLQFDSQWVIQYASGRTEILRWGDSNDVCVPGDYDGDGVTDVATFRHITGTWYIRQSSTLTVVTMPFGALHDLAVPRDYDGDGVTDVAVVRPSTGEWFIRQSSTQSMVTIQPGLAGRPVPADYDGDGKADLALYRESDGTWHILRSSTESWSAVAWGGVINDRPAPADYDGDGRIDLAVFRPSTGVWYVLRSATAQADATTWGIASDTPTAADYDGDGRSDIAVYRSAASTWHIRESSTVSAISVVLPGHGPVRGDYDGDGRADVATFTFETTGMVWRSALSSGGFTQLTWGGAGDSPVPGDYDGDRKTDVAVFRASTGTWHIKLSASPTADAVVWGGVGDVPVPADYDGDGKTDVAVFRPSDGTWYIRQSRTSSSAAMVWGTDGDIPTPADYDGDGLTDVAVFRPQTGEWHIRLTATQAPMIGLWGTAGDIPVAADYDGDGRSDIAVFRPASGTWHIAGPGGPTPEIVWGVAQDLPIQSEPLTIVPRN